MRYAISLLSLLLTVAIDGDALADASVARGEYLVRGPAGCGNCHTPLGPTGFVEGMELAGRLVEDTEELTAYAPNITPAGAVGDWSDEEVVRAIREGRRPDGSLLGAPMPFTMYRGLSDEDAESIVMFLRTLPAVDNEVPKSTYRYELPSSYGPPVGEVTAPPAGATVEYGAYLAGPVAHCIECHTPLNERMLPMLDTSLGTGGYEFHGPWGVSVAANITPHEDGIAEFSDADLAKMIRSGIRPDGTEMLPPMPYSFLAKMTDEDAAAIILYLRSLPPLPGPG
jgi:mono/diheme cytochrome c family protein